MSGVENMLETYRIINYIQGVGGAFKWSLKGK